MLQRNVEECIVALDVDGSSRRKDRAAGMALVALQFALITFIAWPSHEVTLDRLMTTHQVPHRPQSKNRWTARLANGFGH